MFKKIVKLIKDGRNLFITGGGGVGKSYMLEKLQEEFPDLVVTSTTGISALNIGGQTIHSWSGMGICDKDVITLGKKLKENDNKQYLKEATLLAIDEISMLDATKFKYLDDLLSIVRTNPKPFGGIQVILIGDFYQLPPVGMEWGATYCFNSPLWKKLNLETINLTKVHRQKDKKFVTALNHIRQGEITQQDLDLLMSRNNVEPPMEAVRLYATNDEADYYNKVCYDRIKEEQHTFWAYDTITKKDKKGKEDSKPCCPDNLTSKDKEAYQFFDKQCKYGKVVNLKVGSRVMLLYNMDIDDGLVNGSCGYVTGFEDNAVIVKFDNGVKQKIKKQKLTAYVKTGLFQRTQYPLRLAYASTVHKAQGMTMDKVYMNLCNIFSPGQTYVGLSRVTTLKGLFLKGFALSKIMVDNSVIDFYKTFS